MGKLFWIVSAAMISAGLFMSPASADDDDGVWPLFRFPDSDTGIYVGATVGYNDHTDLLSANNDGSLSGINEDQKDSGYSVQAGYKFNDYVAVEGGYLDLGEPKFDAQSDGSGESWVAGDVSTLMEADGWLLSVVGSWPLSERISLFGRLGIYFWDTTETFTENGFETVDKNSGEDAYFGGGVDWDLGEKDKWHLRGEVAQTEVDKDGDKVNMLSAGAYRDF